jgi:deoxynucleoside triphosphate triphosphohydrolase SAMHD1
VPKQEVPGADPERAAALCAEDILVDISSMHHGMGDKNPLSRVMFWSKQRPNGTPQFYPRMLDPDTAKSECQQAASLVSSTVIPKEFGEVLLRIYTRNPRFVLVVDVEVSIT